MSLKEKQTTALIRMLSLNKAPDSKESLDEPWKILIYDDFCRDIVAPLLRVGDLRKYGVTLHLSLMAERQPVADVPAVYFVLPTKENLKRISVDLSNHLYDSYHLNFASHLSQDLMEELALSSLESGTTHQISKLFDQYVHFISFESDLFSLGQKQSFYDFNDPTISDSKAQENINQTVESLFSVLVTMGVVPIIRCAKNGASEAVATQLDAKLNEHLQSMGNLFSEVSGNSTNFQRPVLLLLDRSVDLPIMLHHPWTYQPLVHDLLDMKLNRVQIETFNSETNKKEVKNYDLDEHDTFWTGNTFSPFQNIGEAVNSYLKEYKTTMDDFKKMSGGMELESIDESQVLGRTKDLGSFVNLVPQLKEKKKIIDAHTNIATSLLQHIKDRQLDSYFSIEESLITHAPFDRKELNNLINNETGSTPQDRLRLFLIHYIINNDNIPSNELESMMDTLKKSNINLDAVNYLKKNKAVSNLLGGTSGGNSGSAGGTSGAVRGLFQKVNVDSFGLGSVMSNQLGTLFNAGVRALFPTTKELPATRLLDSVMELKSDPQTDQFLYFDPKVGKKMRSSMPRRNTPFKEAIVFVIGGGNYLEYQNVQEYARKQPGKKVVYGSTEISTPTNFLDQLSKLGSSS